MSQKILDKLEEYEQLAYDGGCGDDWLQDVGEGFKFYIRDCISYGKKPTINGFISHIDEMARKSSTDFESELKRIREKIATGKSSSYEHSLIKNTR